MTTLSVRHARFGIQGPEAVEWIAGDAFRSQFFNSFSMVFPVGERYFIDSLRGIAAEIADDELRASVAAFIGQEASHRRMHSEYNQCLERLGLTNVSEKFVSWRIDHSGWLSPLDHLAITAGVEHFTTALGQGLLVSDDWLAGADARLEALWKWHAAEEVEHGWIPLSVYRSLNGGYLRRLLWFLYVCVTLVLDIGVQTVMNLARSHHLWSLRTWRRGLAFLLGNRGPARCALAAFCMYIQPRYTPARPDSNSRASIWLRDNSRYFTLSRDRTDEGLASPPSEA